MPAGAHQGHGVSDEPVTPSCCNPASPTTSWATVVDMTGTKLRENSKGLQGVELSDLQGEDRLEALAPKSSWTVSSSHRGSCYNLLFAGWRMRRI
jgi:hypothetical protein